MTDRAVSQGFAARLRAQLPAAGILASVLAVAACAPQTKAPIATPPPPTEAPAPEKPAEVVNRIAVLVPLSGTSAPVGVSLANAASLALVDTRKQGIRISSYDTAALGAREAARRAIADGAGLILGPLLAQDAQAIKTEAGAKGITILSFSNDSGIAGGNLYVLGFQPAQSVSRVVEYASSLGMQKFAGLMPDGIYGQRSSVAFTRAVAASGGQVVALSNFERKGSALPAAARKVAGGTVAALSGTEPREARFDALLVADSGAVAAAFSPQLTKFGAPAGSYLMLGTELWATEPGLGKSAALKGAVFASVPNTRFQGMASRYRARFGGTPSRLASLSYDSVLLAASVAGERWKPGTMFPKAVLEDPQGFAGIDGIFRFRDNIADRGLAVQQVTPEGFQTVSPAPSHF